MATCQRPSLNGPPDEFSRVALTPFSRFSKYAVPPLRVSEMLLDSSAVCDALNSVFAVAGLEVRNLTAMLPCVSPATRDTSADRSTKVLLPSKAWLTA